jgi:phosphotransferase family enzyme
MIGEWRALLSKHVTEWGLPAGGEWKFFLYNNYQPNYSALNIFWFHNRDRYPLVVTKLFPEPSLPEQEFQNLQDAYAGAPNLVPRPFGLFQQRDVWALWMAGIRGSKLTPDLLSDAAIDRFCDGLVAIQKWVGTRRPLNPQRYQNLVCKPLEAVIQSCPAISEACSRVLARCTENRFSSTPALPQHGDLYSGNIIVNHDENWHILDWEMFGLVDLPFYDVIRFSFSLGGRPAPDQWHTPIQRHANRLIARYAKALELGQQEFMSLLPLLLANWFYLQPLPEGKALALTALQDYFSRPGDWERALLK